MKIDTHQHYWRYDEKDFPWISADMPVLQKDCAPADVAPALNIAGVDTVVAVQARSCAAETDYLLGLAKANPHIVGVVGWTDLCAANVDQTLDAYADEPLLKGFRHILQDEVELELFVSRPEFSRGVKAVQKRGLVYDVLVFERQIAAMVDFCARHNAHWLVLDHVGKPAICDWRGDHGDQRWIGGLRALASMPHVLCKLSGLVTQTDWGSGAGVSEQDRITLLECFDRALELFGPNRIVYGSDWPVCQLAAPYETVSGLAERWASSRLSPPEQDAFWGGNARRCYDLKLYPLAHVQE
jgi:L-fuconolactonase